MKDIAKTLATISWAIIGILGFYIPYALILSRFTRDELEDLESSLGGFTIHITKNMSMDIPW